MRATQEYVPETIDMSDISENAQGYTWYTILGTLKVDKTKLATHNS